MIASFLLSAHFIRFLYFHHLLSSILVLISFVSFFFGCVVFVTRFLNVCEGVTVFCFLSSPSPFWLFAFLCLTISQSFEIYIFLWRSRARVRHKLVLYSTENQCWTWIQSFIEFNVDSCGFPTAIQHGSIVEWHWSDSLNHLISPTI